MFLPERLESKASMDFEKKLGLIFPDTEPEVKEIPVEKRPSDKKRIPVCEPSLTELENAYVSKVMHSKWISSMGPEVKMFEKEFAEKIGTKYAISCTSGTSALHLALAALNVKPGDEVIIPTFTMVATINAILYCGGKPILVDADECMNMNVRQLEKKITRRTVGILPVHIYGEPCNMDEIVRIANKHKLFVVEDVAESHGAKYKGKTLGSLGDIGCFSFYSNKIIAIGEGGILTTDHEELAERIRTKMNHSFSPERHFCHRLVGFNYRMTALQAAVGRAQLVRWDEILHKKEQLRKRYVERLLTTNLIVIPSAQIDSPVDNNSVCWMFGVLVQSEIKNKIREELANRGIETRNFFVPMHLQPVYYKRFKGQRYPVSESLMEQGFYLPSATDLTLEEIDYVCENLKDIVNNGFGRIYD
jgi:perosamine synthetase